MQVFAVISRAMIATVAVVVLPEGQICDKIAIVVYDRCVLGVRIDQTHDDGRAAPERRRPPVASANPPANLNLNNTHWQTVRVITRPADAGPSCRDICAHDPPRLPCYIPLSNCWRAADDNATQAAAGVSDSPARADRDSDVAASPSHIAMLLTSA